MENVPQPRTIVDIQRRLSTHLHVEDPDPAAVQGVQALAPLFQQAMQTEPKTPPITMAEFVAIDYSQLTRHLQET